MTTASTSTKKVFFLFRWLSTLMTALSGLGTKALGLFKKIIKFFVDLFLFPARAIGWTVVTGWTLFWNVMGCIAILILTGIIVVMLIVLPVPGMMALALFAGIYGLTTLVWLAHREIRKEVRNERRAKWITFIGVSICILTLGAALPFILLGWIIYRLLKPRLMNRFSNARA